MFVVRTTPSTPLVKLFFTTTFAIFESGGFIMTGLAVEFGFVFDEVGRTGATVITTSNTMGPTILILWLSWHELAATVVVTATVTITVTVTVAVFVAVSVAVVVAIAVAVAFAVSIAVAVVVAETLSVLLLLDGHVDKILEPFLHPCLYHG